METKKDKFIRLAEKRVNNLLKQMELVGNLANKRNYDYSDKEARAILTAIKKAYQNLEVQFDSAKNKKFKLK